MSRIFINYRRQDSEGYVGRLYDHLLKHFLRDDIDMLAYQQMSTMQGGETVDIPEE